MYRTNITRTSKALMQELFSKARILNLLRLSYCAQILGHLKFINFPFGTNGKLMFFGVLIIEHFQVACM